jgi:ssDNA-binding Zn-finger/Zn-ribbon topoisomerase 1
MPHHNIIVVDCGPYVVCDFCNKEFTESEEVGGSAIGSWAICPECTKKLSEEPDQRAAEGETFRDFVYRLRGD